MLRDTPLAAAPGRCLGASLLGVVAGLSLTALALASSGAPLSAGWSPGTQGPASAAGEHPPLGPGRRLNSQEMKQKKKNAEMHRMKEERRKQRLIDAEENKGGRLEENKGGRPEENKGGLAATREGHHTPGDPSGVHGGDRASSLYGMLQAPTPAPSLAAPDSSSYYHAYYSAAAPDDSYQSYYQAYYQAYYQSYYQSYSYSYYGEGPTPSADAGETVAAASTPNWQPNRKGWLSRWRRSPTPAPTLVQTPAPATAAVAAVATVAAASTPDWPPHRTGPVNFVLVTTQRSGSHFMLQMLKSHPEVTLTGDELFRHAGNKVESILDDFYKRRHGDQGVHGFKAVSEKQWGGAASAFAKHNVKVIFLWRQNRLRQLVSLMAKKVTTAHPQGKKLDKVQRYLPTLPVGKEFEERLKELSAEQAAGEAQYAKFENMHVHYEDIIATSTSCEARWRRIQEFLGLPPRTLHTDFPAIHEFSKIEDTISNWSQVKRYIESKPEYRSMLLDAGDNPTSVPNPACGG